MTLWQFLERQQLKLSDVAVVGTAGAGFGFWFVYEMVARVVGRTDALAVTLLLLCGTPLTLGAGGYALVRSLRQGRGVNMGALAALIDRLLGKAEQTAEPEPPPPAAPDMSDWSEVVAEVHRRSKPVFPLGKTLAGKLAGVSFEETPHLLVNGQTGSGKTMAVLRPLAVCAAISGLFQVIILDKSGRNFRLLEPHPNIHLVRYEPETLPTIAAALYGEILRRDRWLAKQPGNPTLLTHVRADRRPPRLLVIIDEYANARGLLHAQDPKLAGKLTSAMIQCVQEGRAMGVHLMIVAQRPDATQLNTTHRSQYNAITFHMRDATDARLADAPGAETVGQGQAIFSRPRGRTTLQMYYPSDAQIRQALSRQGVKDWGKPDWLQAVTALGEGVPETAVLPAVTGYNGWEMGENGATAEGNGGDDGVTVTPSLADRLAGLLTNSDPSPIAGLTVGQFQAAFLCLLLGESLTATCHRVLGGKNGRYLERVRAVQQLVAAVAADGSPALVQGVVADLAN